MSSTTHARVSGDCATGGNAGDLVPVLPALPLHFPRQWVKVYEHTARARARIADARTITVPACEVEQMVAEYETLGLVKMSKRFGYSHNVIRRALIEAGVSIRGVGQPRKWCR